MVGLAVAEVVGEVEQGQVLADGLLAEVPGHLLGADAPVLDMALRSQDEGGLIGEAVEQAQRAHLGGRRAAFVDGF